MANETDFIIEEAGRLRAKFGLSAENRSRIVLDPQRVPANLQHLIALAEKYGESDDLIRDDVVAKAPPEEKEQLRLAIREADHCLMNG